MNVIQFILNNPQLIIFALIFILPAIGKILKAMSEAAEKKRLARERERAEIDALRTGRAGVGAAPLPSQATMAPPPPQVDQAALRRQQRLEDARRRAQQRQQQTQAQGRASPAPRPSAPPSTSTAPGMQRIELPGGIVLEVPQGAPPPPQPRPQPQAQSRPKPTKAQRQQARAQAAQPARAVPQPSRPAARATDAYAEESTQRLVKDATRPGLSPRRRRPVTVAGVSMSARDFRRAFVLREILDPPVAMREPSQADPSSTFGSGRPAV